MPLIQNRLRERLLRLIRRREQYALLHVPEERYAFTQVEICERTLEVLTGFTFLSTRGARRYERFAVYTEWWTPFAGHGKWYADKHHLMGQTRRGRWVAVTDPRSGPFPRSRRIAHHTRYATTRTEEDHVTYEPIGSVNDLCPVTGRPHELEWKGTQTEQCIQCMGYVWFRQACMSEEDLKHGLPYERTIYRVIR